MLEQITSILTLLAIVITSLAIGAVIIYLLNIKK